MSEVLYSANPSVWRTRPMGTLIAWLLVAAGAYVGLTGHLPYAQLLIDRFPALASFDLRIVGYAIGALGLFNLLRWWLSCLVDRLEIRPNEILWTHGLLNKNYTEINMSSIRTVRVYQSLLQRMLGAGDLVIFTTGDDPELAVRGLPHPNDIRDHIRQRAPTTN